MPLVCEQDKPRISGHVFPRLGAHTCKGQYEKYSEFHTLISRENKGPKYK